MDSAVAASVPEDSAVLARQRRAYPPRPSARFAAARKETAAVRNGRRGGAGTRGAPTRVAKDPFEKLQRRHAEHLIPSDPVPTGAFLFPRDDDGVAGHGRCIMDAPRAADAGLSATRRAARREDLAGDLREEDLPPLEEAYAASIELCARAGRFRLAEALAAAPLPPPARKLPASPRSNEAPRPTYVDQFRWRADAPGSAAALARSPAPRALVRRGVAAGEQPPPLTSEISSAPSAASTSLPWAACSAGAVLMYARTTLCRGRDQILLVRSAPAQEISVTAPLRQGDEDNSAAQSSVTALGLEGSAAPPSSSSFALLAPDAGAFGRSVSKGSAATARSQDLPSAASAGKHEAANPDDAFDAGLGEFGSLATWDEGFSGLRCRRRWPSACAIGSAAALVDLTSNGVYFETFIELEPQPIEHFRAKSPRGAVASAAAGCGGVGLGQRPLVHLGVTAAPPPCNGERDLDETHACWDQSWLISTFGHVHCQGGLRQRSSLEVAWPRRKPQPALSVRPRDGVVLGLQVCSLGSLRLFADGELVVASPPEMVPRSLVMSAKSAALLFPMIVIGPNVWRATLRRC
eukprot:TRINITY_DN39818_c0_g1_i1.p1 TRINITY_DN39818_c0_g1~~TRINITY_DN39818_c0_g1_i1.p1  ORF type:complete len:578 (+),score=114.49 TRINITY_DN39818_c0_g1_i1:54-1787(+)